MSGELLVKVFVDRDATIGQLLARMKEEGIDKASIQDWRENGKLVLLSSQSHFANVWPLKEDVDLYTRIMRTEAVRSQLAEKKPVVFQFIRSCDDDEKRSRRRN